jgi:wobble nucleotide-excising tRNase
MESISKELKEAYRLAGIDRSKLPAKHRPIIESFFNTIISICKKQDVPLSDFKSDLEEIGKKVSLLWTEDAIE